MVCAVLFLQKLNAQNNSAKNEGDPYRRAEQGFLLQISPRFRSTKEQSQRLPQSCNFYRNARNAQIETGRRALCVDWCL